MVLVAMLGVALSALLYLDARHRKTKESIGNEHSCQSNLNNIAIALMNYRGNFGQFPPPFSTDGGRRARSWRASILPWFSFDQDLAAEYDYDTPWDSAENIRLSQGAPTFYRCPADRGTRPPQDTSYFMINDLSNLNLKSIPDHAILVIEASNIIHDWRSPFDDLNDLEIRSITSVHPSGFGVVLADFTRLRLNDTKTIKKQGNIYTIDDRIMSGGR